MAQMKAGDTWPPLVVADDGVPVKLGRAKAKYCYRSKRDGRLIRRPLRIIDAERGRVAPPSRAPAGVDVWIEIHWPQGTVETIAGVEVVD